MTEFEGLDLAAEINQEVDGAGLLQEISDAIGEYIHVPIESLWICALYVAATYSSHIAEVLPRLAILSPEPGCGKTNLMNIISQLVWKPLPAAVATGAAISRSLTADRPPTLLLDEIQDLLKQAGSVSDDNSAALVYTVLKAGYKRESFRLVSDKESLDPLQLPIWSFAVMAGKIMSLPDQLSERTIHIYLERKPDGSGVRQWHSGHRVRFTELRERLEAWVNQNSDIVCRPDLIETELITARESEIWSSLWNVAVAAGGPWPDRWGDAMMLAQAAEKEHEMPSLQKLALSHVFCILMHYEVEFMPTRRIIEEMLNPEREWPWTADKNSKTRINEHMLGRYLRSYKIRSAEQHRNGPMGYRLADVAPEFVKYM